MENIQILKTLANEAIDNIGTFNILSSTVFLLLAIYSIIQTFRSVHRRLPLYAIKTVNLISNTAEKINSLQIHYSGKPVSDVTVSHIAIWNGGKETINRNDIAPKDKFLVRACGAVDILEAEIIFSKNKVNNFTITVSPKNIKVNFDYFDFNEGVIIKVIHTGTNSTDLVVSGTVKKIGPLKNINKPLLSYLKVIDVIPTALTEKGFIKFERIFIPALLIIFPLVPLIDVFFPDLTQPTPKISLIMAAILALILWPAAYLICKRRVPKGFELFEQEY